MKRLFLHLFVALVTSSFGVFLWWATESQSLQTRQQEAHELQQKDTQHAIQSMMLWYELYDRSRRSGCFKRETIAENKRLFCAQIQQQLEYLSKEFR